MAVKDEARRLHPGMVMRFMSLRLRVGLGVGGGLLEIGGDEVRGDLSFG
jgi:hypothetical protein